MEPPIEQATAAPGEKRKLVEAEEVKVLRLQDGDVLVVKLNGNPSAGTIQEARYRLREIIPERVEVMVITNGVDLEVLRDA